MQSLKLPKILIAPWLILFTLTVLLFLDGCQQVTIKDETIYADKGDLGAFEAHTLTTPTRDVPKIEWDNLRVGMLCMSPDSFGDYKQAIEKLCSYEKNVCDYNMQQALQSFFLHMEPVIREANKFKGSR